MSTTGGLIGRDQVLAVLRASSAQGALVLWGRCSETEGAPPFWPWAQIVRAAADAGTKPPEAVGGQRRFRIAARTAELASGR